MKFRNLFGQRPQAQQEETVVKVENAVENNVKTSVYHLIVLDESGSMRCITRATIT